MVHFLNYVDEAIKKNWDKPAVSNYGANTYTYGQMAASMERMHLLFKECGIKRGDKVALCAKNSAEWCISFLAIVSYDAVAVPLLPDFLPSNVADLTRLSGSRMLMLDTNIYDALSRDGVLPQFASYDKFLGLVDVLSLDALAGSSNELVTICAGVESAFARKFPSGVKAMHINYCKNDVESLALISYTSGTSSAPKGVMLRAKSISGNIEVARRLICQKENGKVLSILPLAHIMGLSFDFIFTIAGGCHLNILTTKPTPARLLGGLGTVKPFMFLTVPLVIEKIFKSKVFPATRSFPANVLLKIPGLDRIVLNKIKKSLLTAFGNGFTTGLILGGAALNREVEDLLKRMKFPYVVGYGMTECGPLISYCDKSEFVKYSCGKKANPLELRIDSANPRRILGEIQVKGDAVMLGYYKNADATAATFTEDGWLRTGDLGYMDKKQFVYIRGRIKSMFLGASGQNIYPEEIEDKLNNQTGVAESVVVEREGKLIGLVFPDEDQTKNFSLDDLKNLMKENLKKLNDALPSYSRVHDIEIKDEPFEKTPKKSIKRFLYK